MNQSRLISLIFAVGVMNTSCFGTGGQQGEPVKAKKKQNNGSTVATTPTTKIKITPKAPPSMDSEYVPFYYRMASPDKDYTERDRQLLMSFPPTPSPASPHEAALVVGVLRDIVTPVGGIKSTFKEVDIGSPAQPSKNSIAVIDKPINKPDPSTILEVRCREKGIDCVGALATNPLLKNHAVYNLAIDAVRLPGNSPLFIQNLETTLKSEVQHWGDLARKLGLEVQPVNTATAPTAVSPSEDIETPSTPPTETPPATPVITEAANAAALQSMNKALELAAKDDFENAIVEARKVPQGAENYSSAQDNIKSWANRAVQDLRRQAANQYRSSTSVNEANGKKVFLTKAKTHLETAITKYPEASTLDTVKENLEIINKELARLK